MSYVINVMGRMMSMKYNSLDFDIYVGNLFEMCESEDQVEWLKDQLSTSIDCLGDERIDELESEEE